MPKTNFQTSFKNSHQASFLARDIASFFNRGSSLENRIETTLNHLREWTGTKSLKQLDNQRIEAFITTLQDKLSNGELSRKTVENYVSALNRIVEYVNARLDKNLETVSAKEFGLSRGSFEFVNRAVSQATHEKFLNFLSEKPGIQAESLQISIKFERDWGLRLRESIAIKLETVNKALETGVLHLTKNDGTKNGREREIPIINEAQRNVLLEAKDFMEKNGLSSLCPTATLKEQYNFAWNMAKEFRETTGEKFTFHGERHAFAQEMINQGFDRQTVSEWLGHGREEITKVYVK
jgi:site-specific recombinase XerD